MAPLVTLWDLMGLERAEVLSLDKYIKVVWARSVVCFWGKCEIGISQDVLAQKFAISQSTISMAVKRGEVVVNRNNFSLLDL